jgi:hypothetical protein
MGVHTRTSLRHAGVVGAVATVTAIGLSTPASASVSTNPLAAVQPNGRVSAVAVSAGVVYLGGDFTSVRDLNGVQNARGHLAAVSATTGALLGWAPDANGSVDALAISGGTIYAGGDFTSVAGAARGRLAAISSTGIVQNWNPGANRTVSALAASSSRLYAGGLFTTAGGAKRTRLAAFSLASGALDASWHPSTVGKVLGLTLAPDNSRVYVTGGFSSLNGQSSSADLAAVDPTSGQIDATFAAHPGFLIYGVAVDAQGVVAAGGGPGGSLLQYDNGGALVARTLTDGGVQALGILAGEAYAGGHFTAQGSLQRRKLFSVLRGSAAATGWNPAANSALGVFVVTPDPATGRLYVGGDFTTINSRALAHFATFG